MKYAILLLSLVLTALPVQALPHEAAIKETRAKGWGYLLDRLAEHGINPKLAAKVFADARMPKFTPIPFKLRPKESHAQYSHFLHADKLRKAQAFFHRYRSPLAHLQKTYAVDPQVVVALLMVETQLGEYTGEHLVLHRLARLASIDEPTNLLFNLEKIRTEEEPKVTLNEVEARAQYLVTTFTPELVALFEISQARKINPLGVKGSVAGAFGLPQFLPRSYLRYAVDGNKNGVISLYEPVDAMWSVANYLKSSGWNQSSESKRKALWAYNKSDAYIDTVLQLASRISR